MRENNFGEYIKQKESDKYYKGYLWDTAIGLLEAEGLEPSNFLWEIARQSVYGEITLVEAEQRIKSYYNQETWRTVDSRTTMADKIAGRIISILTSTDFFFEPSQYMEIHRKLFEEIYEHAGEVRRTDITRQEWTLGGESMIFSDVDELREALEYGMYMETKFSYINLSVDEAIKHIAQFIAMLWQLHIFEKGNTMTTALFLIKYLNFIGLDINLDVFSKNAGYFRNALVRAIYRNEAKKVYETTIFLEAFLRNMILKEANPLRNEYLLVNTIGAANTDPINDPIEFEADDSIKQASDPINDPINHEENHQVEKLTAREISVLELIKTGKPITRNEMAKKLKCSEATVKRAVVSLTKKGLIVREGSNKTGYWRVASD